MFKQLLNECVVDLDIIPQGPILVKSGIDTVSGPNMAFVRTWRAGELQVYLPGSSLKGVLRSQAERIARTINPASACNPFAKIDSGRPDVFCGEVFKKLDNPRFRDRSQPELSRAVVNQRVYRDSCPICRLFGSTYFAGRLGTEDAYVKDGHSPAIEQRDGVGIDRFTGGSANKAKFDLEVATGGVFSTRLHLKNFELWQLGLVGVLLADLKDGLLTVGSGRSRGLGRVKGQVNRVQIDLLGPNVQQNNGEGQVRLSGLAGLAGEQGDIGAYGLAAEEVVWVSPPTPPARVGLRTRLTFPDDSFPWERLFEAWVVYAKDHVCAAKLPAYQGEQR